MTRRVSSYAARSMPNRVHTAAFCELPSRYADRPANLAKFFCCGQYVITISLFPPISYTMSSASVSAVCPNRVM